MRFFLISLQHAGPVLEILNSTSGLVYSTGSYLSMECLYLNTSRAVTVTTTPHPLFPVDQKIPLPYDVLKWTLNNRTFSLRNRKRSIETRLKTIQHTHFQSSCLLDRSLCCFCLVYKKCNNRGYGELLLHPTNYWREGHCHAEYIER